MARRIPGDACSDSALSVRPVSLPAPARIRQSCGNVRAGPGRAGTAAPIHCARRSISGSDARTDAASSFVDLDYSWRVRRESEDKNQMNDNEKQQAIREGN